MEKTFIPKDHEEKLYAEWEKSGVMHANNRSGKKKYCVVLPPPNANANLHLGHAMYVNEDIMIRYHKLKGEEVLWLPGADHAGFETQFVFEKHLAKEGKSRFDFNRETLYKMIWDFVHQNRSIMENQLRRLGFFLDWARRKFTLDADTVKIVYATFEKLFNDGLIYRDHRLVNYCTHCGTGFSDLEVVHIEQKDPLYYLKYGPFTLATVRPETKFGDTAVAVNPKDKRYSKWIGKEIEVEGLLGTFKIKVVGDSAIDPKFGTGAAKVTPAHDFTDYEIAKRHQLEFKEVINKQGRLTEIAGPYKGLKVLAARKKVAEDLSAKGLMVKVDEAYVHTVSACYKCNRVLEPLLMPQWYVKVRPLADKAIEAIKKKKVVFLQKKFEKRGIQWLTDFHDWNISRQIVWGIQIPAYLCKSKKWFVSVEKPDKCHICGTCSFEQDTDTFDTWFSSGQWPFTTLQTTGEGDFKNFYPTSVMETGYEILPWWVCRMLMLGIYVNGTVPFEKIFLHGMVRDSKGQKMSKSKGNVINPLDMVEKYGADALRAALVFNTLEGNDTAVSEQKIVGMRNFANKIWNIGRFILLNRNTESTPIPDKQNSKQSETITQLSVEFRRIQIKIKKEMDAYTFSIAFNDLYEFIWHRFADYYIEALKDEMRSGNINTIQYVEEVYRECLRLLHPFMPFVTEAVYKEFNGENASIIS